MSTLPSSSAESPIDVVVYLASLCSDPRPVDPMLDQIRRITVRINGPDELTAEDLATIAQVRKSLEDYLVTKEPVRSFAREELQSMIYEHFQGKNRLAWLRKTMAAIFIGMVVVFGVSMILPIGSIGYRLGFGVTNALGICLLGVMGLYLTALKSFTRELRSAFVFISVAISISALTVGLRTVLSSLNHEGASGTDLWWIGLLYPVVSGLHLMGVRQYSRAIRLPSLFAHPGFLGSLSLVALVIGFLPHANSPLPDWTLKLVLGATWLVILYSGSAAVLALQIRQKVNLLYRSSLAWFSLSLLTTAVASTLTFIVHFFFPHIGGSVNGVIAMLYVPSTIFLLISGYAFNRIGRH